MPQADHISRPKNGYLPTLDGWRAIAILSVLIYHDHRYTSLGGTVVALQDLGRLGVNLFFAISGLLITSRLLEEEQVFGRFSMKGFYVRRFFRILPPAFTFLFVLVLLHLAGHFPLGYRGVVAALVFVRNYLLTPFHDLGMRVTEHFWSLSVEEQYYLFMPSFLLVVKARRLRFAGLLTLGLLFTAWLLVGPHILPQVYGNVLTGHFTELNIHGILLASALAILLADHKMRLRATPLLRPYFVIPFCAVVAVIWHHIFLVDELYVFAFPLLIMSTVLHPKGWLGSVLEWPPLRYIGRMSYSLYLWQQLVFVAAELAKGTSFSWLGMTIVEFPLAFLFAAGSFYLIEKPAIRFGHRISPPLTPGRPDLHEKPLAAAAS